MYEFGATKSGSPFFIGMTKFKTLLAAVAASCFIGCADDPLATTVAALKAGDVFELERAASIASASGATDDLERLEPAIDRALEEGYASLDTRVLLQHALVQWARLVRQRWPDPLHTAVPGLIDDPDCQGSVIGDGVLLRYASAISHPKGDSSSERSAISAMESLARHMACLGEDQSRELALRMVLAHDEVNATLRLNRRNTTLPYLASAIAQPMVLVQDVERQQGPEAPLARWFADHAAVLSEAADKRHNPVAWHGLWLYDRILGRLVGFRVADNSDSNSADENTVDFPQLIEVLARATTEENHCSLAEMVRRGTSKLGYQCAGQRCGENPDLPECNLPQVGGDPKESGGGIPAGMNIPGLATSSAVACVASQVARPGEKQMKCVVEATGFGAKPLGHLVKGLAEVGLAGIKVGDECTKGEVTGNSSGDSSANDKPDKEVKDAQEAFERGVEAYQTILDGLLNVMIEARAQRDKLALTKSQDDPEYVNAAAKAETAQENYNAFAEKKPAIVNQLATERDAKIKDKQNKEKDQKAKDKESKDKPKQQEGSGSNTDGGSGSNKDKGSNAGSGSGSGSAAKGRCDPRSPVGSACGNGCGAMAAQAALNKCFDDKTEFFDPYKGAGGCGKNCDPVEPDGAKFAGSACFQALGADDPTTQASRQCWNVRCEGASTANDGCCGTGFGDDPVGSGRMHSDLCAEMRCDHGSPTLVQGRCACGSEDTVLPGQTIIPPVPSKGIPSLPGKGTVPVPGKGTLLPGKGTPQVPSEIGTPLSPRDPGNPLNPSDLGNPGLPEDRGTPTFPRGTGNPLFP